MRGKVVKQLRRQVPHLTGKVRNDYNIKMFHKEIETGKTMVEGKKEVKVISVGTIRLTPDSPKAVLKELKRGYHGKG